MWIIYNLSQKRRNVCRWLQSIRGIGQKEGTKMFTALDAWWKPARTAIEPQRQNLTLQQSIGLIKLSCCKRKLSRNNHQLQVWSCDSAHTCLHITSVCFRDEPLTSCSESHGLRNEPFTQKQVRTVNTTKSWLIRTSKHQILSNISTALFLKFTSRVNDAVLKRSSVRADLQPSCALKERQHVT